MQQVDKKNYIISIIISFIVISFMVGCSSKNEYTNSIKYFDNNVTKDKLLHAAKKVFYFAGKDTYIIDSYRDDLNVTKSKAAYKLYTMDIENDHFDFNVDNNTSNKELKATVSIYRAYGINNDSTSYVEKKSEVYNLFWDRLEYFLGLKKEWKECAFYDFEGYLCDPIDLENKEAKKENILDLNTTEYHNTKQMMLSQKRNTLAKDKSMILTKKKREQLKNTLNNPSRGSDNTQEKYGVLYDDINTFDSYKIEPVDNNSSIKYDGRVDKLKYNKSNTRK
jgi:hypothetical protein